MKSLKVLFILLIAFSATNINAQTVKETFWVGGVCEMCKDRIEKAMDTSGVKFASYDSETHQLEIAYNSKKITSEEIHSKLNAVGHDTAKSKASDEQYNNIHSCCKYRDHKPHGKSSCGSKSDSCCDKDKKGDACCDNDKKKDSCEKKCKDDHDHGDEEDDHDEH